MGSPLDPDHGELDIFIVAGESSGDELGASLMQSLRALNPAAQFRGVGGPAMQQRGFQSIFPMADIAVMGFLPVLARLPGLIARINQTAQAIIETRPDILVIIDSPDFTHRVARKVRAQCPQIPIVDYVSPSVWAWRPGRARRMAAYVDHLLALLPFEPAAHARLGGPACTYTGHPLVEKLDVLRGPGSVEEDKRPLLAVLPGSRRSEIRRLMPVFGETAAILHNALPGLKLVLPAVPHLREELAAAAKSWTVPVEIVSGDEAKYALFRNARAALAASGTVTLELALAHVPTVLAYKVSALEAAIARRIVQTPFIGLPNIIAGRQVIPEFIQEAAEPKALAAALLPLLGEGEPRARQLAAFDEIENAMRLPEGETPSGVAARTILQVLKRSRSN